MALSTFAASSIVRAYTPNRIQDPGRLWGARHPGQLQPVDEVSGWSLDASAKAEIERVLSDVIKDPVGPEFMAPPARDSSARSGRPRRGHEVPPMAPQVLQ
jgi:hypothetical protein